MSRCLPGRAVSIRLRHRRIRLTKEYVVVCPLRWSRSRFLAHVRAEHPDETVVLLDWPQLGWNHIWIVHPDDMTEAK